MDKLEKFIIENKNEFEEPRQPEEGWKGLKEKMEPQKMDWSTAWKVAAMLFFISTAVMTISKISDEPVQVANLKPANSIEDFFVQMIDFKREEYLALANESDREELFQDLAELDSAYANLKTSYEQLEQEELLEAMLENLQVRVYILNEQIEILKNGDKSQEEVYFSS